MIDGDHGDIAVDQLHHLGVVEVHTGNHHAVHTAVVAVLQVGHRFAAQVAVDKGDIVAQPLHPDFETVQHGGEIFVAQTALAFVHKQNAEVISTVGLHGAGRHVGHIAQPLGCFTDAGPGGIGDIVLAVERLAHGGYRDSALPCQIFQG